MNNQNEFDIDLENKLNAEHYAEIKRAKEEFIANEEKEEADLQAQIKREAEYDKTVINIREVSAILKKQIDFLSEEIKKL